MFRRGQEMKSREIAAKVLFLLALPFVFLGLIDPLEGGLALIVAAVLYLIAFLLIKELPAKSLWIPFALSILVGVLTILFVTVWDTREPQEPLNLVVRIGLWIYRALVAVTLIGAIMNAVRFFRRKTT